ncbi:DUF6603 domain-containing protein [Streptomyces sp. MJM8645]|uniref:DUF6603 domain-containing protein n=1 Tax=Streptomycetaceae TaxID=2062 RepID=UPI000AAC1814|nr:DUF6603 domain-containing protein [Streptomyces sp. MJM8645]
MAERMKLLLKGRGGYPFADELVNRKPGDLDQVQPVGGIKLARHHVIPFETLIKSWNAAIENAYNVKGSSLRAGLEEFADTVVRKFETLDYTDQEKLNFPRIKEFVETFKDPDSSYDPDGITLDGLDDIHNILTWLPGNLFVGPDNQNRTDDPGPKVESGSARIIGQEALTKRTAAFASLDRFSKKPKGGGMEKDGVQGFKGLIEAFTPNRVWPLKGADWEPDGAKYRIRPVGSLSGTAAEPLTCAPALGMPQGVDFVIIGGTRLDLDTWSDESGYLFRGATAENVRMADLFDWLGENWGVAGEIPEGLRSFDLQYLTIEVLTSPGGPEEWEFTAATEARLGDTVMDLLVCFRHSTPAAGGASTFSLSADAGFTAAVEGAETRLWFSGAIAKTGSGAWELSASLESDGQALTLAHLAAAVGIDVPADLDPFVPSLGSASFAYRLPVGTAAAGSLVVSAVVGRVGVVVASVPEGTGPAVARLVAVRGVVGARASDLPLVGESIPADRDVVVTGVQFCYADRAWPLAQVRALNAAVAGLPGAAQGLLPVLLDEALQRGLLIWGLLTMGGRALAPLVWRPNSTGAAALSQGGSGDLVPLDTSEGAVVLGRERAAVAGQQRSDSAQELDQVFGPVRIRRVSLGYAKGRLFVAFDATLTLGPVALDMIGLGLAVDQDFTVTPVLAGSGVRIAIPPLKVTGVLEVRQDPAYEVYIAGLVAVEAGFFAMQAAGSYARSRGGWASVFLFGEVAAKGGVALFGPPAFTVTGLSGGFGVNSSVRVPRIEELPEFPLIARLDGRPEATPQEILNALTDWVRPADGQYWGAIGVQFTTFKFIDTKALALVEFGRELNVMLLGRTSITFPRNAAPGKKVHARLDLDLKLAYQQSQGLLSLDVAVGAGSFIFDPACRLTGGIAVYVWTAGSRAGDFVLSVGGYHPRFKVPAHYPRPARLGFTWSPDSKIMVKAEGYTALTPGAFMIGGRLAATYTSGLLSAWFTAYLDVLIQWKPFYLDMALGISIGVAFTIKVWFVKVRVSISVGINLALWTPPFGGRVTVKVWFISFSFDIGSKREPLPAAEWSEVRAQLPAPLAITPEKGLLADVDAGELAARRAVEAPLLVSRDGFVFTTESALPATHVYLNDDLVGSADPAIAIRPMRKTAVTSEHRVTLWRNNGDKPFDPVNWTITVLRKDAARALWGAPLNKPGDALDEDTLLPRRLSGLRFEIPGPKLDPKAATGPITSRALGTEKVNPDSKLTGRPGQSAGPAPVSGSGSIDTIARTIAGKQPRRDAAYAAMARLGVAPGANGPRAKYAAIAADTLVSSPLLTAAN